MFSGGMQQAHKVPKQPLLSLPPFMELSATSSHMVETLRRHGIVNVAMIPVMGDRKYLGLGVCEHVSICVW